MQIEVDKITFMGHQVTRNGLEIDPENVEAIQNMKQPTCVEDVRRFVGMANFVARYIPSLTGVLHPLHNLMKLLDHIPNMLWKIPMAQITIWIEIFFGNFSKKTVRYILQLRWCHMYS